MNAYVDDMSKVIDYLREIKPTIMCAVPRFYEKIYMSVFEKLDADEPWRKKLFLWALGVGEAVYLRNQRRAGRPVTLAGIPERRNRRVQSRRPPRATRHPEWQAEDGTGGEGYATVAPD